MVNDTLSDVLTRIRNGCLNSSQVVSIPLTRLSQQICHTLEKEGFIESFYRDQSLNDMLIVKLKYKTLITGKAFKQNNEKSNNYSQKNSETLNQPVSGLSSGGKKRRPCITNLKQISKPGLRVYARHQQIPTVLGGLGILILSTPKGIMTDREARFKKVGGEILCSVW